MSDRVRLSQGVLLDGTHCFLAALAGTGVGFGSLAAAGESLTVADASEALDLREAFKVALLFATKVAFNEDLAILNHMGDVRDLLVAERSGADIWIDPGLAEDFEGGGASDPMNVEKGCFDALVVGNFDSE